MCGIIASISRDHKKFNNSARVWEQYKDQCSRGKDGYGFVAVKDGEVRFVRAISEEKIKEALDKLGDTDLIIFHHRIPTCSINSIESNHPIFVHNKKNLQNKYFIVHNGMISNDDQLKKEHEALGIEYKTFSSYKIGEQSKTEYGDYTDSEALGVEMALYIEGKIQSANFKGGVACFILEIDQANNPVAFYAYRNTNPIKHYNNQVGQFFSSAGKGRDLPTDILFRYDLVDHVITKHKIVIGTPVPPTPPKDEHVHNLPSRDNDSTVITPTAIIRQPPYDLTERINDLSRIPGRTHEMTDEEYWERQSEQFASMHLEDLRDHQARIKTQIEIKKLELFNYTKEEQQDAYSDLLGQEVTDLSNELEEIEEEIKVFVPAPIF